MSEFSKLITLLAVVFVLPLTILARCAVVQDQEAQTYQQLHKCTFVNKVETENKRYCGKACWRPEIRETYQCDNGPLIYLK